MSLASTNVVVSPLITLGDVCDFVYGTLRHMLATRQHRAIAYMGESVFDTAVNRNVTITLYSYVVRIYTYLESREYFTTPENILCYGSYICNLINRVVANSGGTVRLTSRSVHRLFAVTVFVLDVFFMDDFYKTVFYARLFGIDVESFKRLHVVYMNLLDFKIPLCISDDEFFVSSMHFPHIRSINPSSIQSRCSRQQLQIQNTVFAVASCAVAENSTVNRDFL
jgi:hypothetical protein